MKILLISPANKNLRVTKQNERPKGHRYFRFSMLSLLYVAGATPKDVDIKLIDEQIEAINYEESVDLVGISFMTALSERAYEIASKFRNRGVKVVFGGFHTSLYPNEALQHADAICIGEAETTWPKLIEDFKGGKLKRIYKSNQRADLSKLNLPRRDLLKTKDYAPITAVQASRGCNHKCNFCSVTEFFKHQHCVRSLDDVVSELKNIKDNKILFVDDNIVANIPFAKELFKRMVPLKKKWISQASIDIADDEELLKLAKKSGCVGLFIGIETLNEQNLEKSEKGFNQSDQYRQRIKTIHKHGIGIEAGIVFGFDQDDRSVFENTLNFLIENNIEAVQVSILTPLPGTPLHESMDKEERINTKDWQYYDYRHTVIEPKLMSSEELQAGADWVINRFYSPLNIVKRVSRSSTYLGFINSTFFCLGINLAYVTRIFQWSIRGYNPARKFDQKVACEHGLNTKDSEIFSTGLLKIKRSLSVITN